jgi:hypothetical protein
MKYTLFVLFLAGCDAAVGTNVDILTKQAARVAGDTMSCDFNKRHVCVCVWKDAWFSASGLAIDPTGASCQ